MENYYRMSFENGKLDLDLNKISEKYKGPNNAFDSEAYLLEVRSILSNWKELKTLKIPYKMDEEIDLKSYQSIRKVIFGKGPTMYGWDPELVSLDPDFIYGEDIWGYPWIRMSKIWYDPQEKSSRVDRILNPQQYVESGLLSIHQK